MASFNIKAPAKINLALAVLGKRPDGFHEIRSWVVRLDWADELQFDDAPAFSFELVGGSADVPADDRNLVCRAAREMAARSGRDAACSIRLEKRIPSGAGLGGGSSDAAATLIGLNRLWRLGWSIDRLAEIGARIGSDVPLFLHAGPVLIEGRGERVSSFRLPWRGFAAIVLPDCQIATKDVYAAFAGSSSRSAGVLEIDEVAARSAAGFMPRLFNDLESAAFSVCAQAREIHHRLDGFEGRTVRMTGSGSAMFSLFDTELEASRWAEQAMAQTTESIKIHICRVE